MKRWCDNIQVQHDKGTATFAPMSDAGNRPPNVHWVVTGSSVMESSPPGAYIRAEAESVNSSRVTIRDARPDHGHAHIADVTVWASGPEPLTEETIAVASAIYWSWWRALDMHGEAPCAMKCEACGKEGTLDIRATLIRCSFCDAEWGRVNGFWVESKPPRCMECGGDGMTVESEPKTCPRCAGTGREGGVKGGIDPSAAADAEPLESEGPCDTE